MTDVRLYQTNDGGEITYTNGNPEMATVEMETAAYLSLVGGNIEDDASAGADAFQWWGNRTETNPVFQYRSRFQGAIQGSKNLTGDILRIEEAATEDLGWLISESIADEISVAGEVPAYNAFSLTVDILVGDNEYSFVFLATVTP